MSRGVCRKSLDVAGGVELGGGQDWFKVDGQTVVLHGDPVAPHGVFPHSAPTQTATSSWLTIGGTRVAAQGDPATCGHVTSGSDWFKIP